MHAAAVALSYLFAAASPVLAQYTATYLPWTAPDKTEGDQSGVL